MATTDFKSVDEYIKSQPAAVQPVLERVRGIIRKAVPSVDESLSYQIAVFKLHGANVIYLAGYKKHYSLYPVSEGILETLKDEVAPYLAAKATLRFPLSEPVPAKLIERIVKIRAKEAVASAKDKAPAKRH
jgi:uncharacterized protein YdhG (YjbR/CyaY superfamily)